jgi:S1-C subfamily serine protease
VTSHLPPTFGADAVSASNFQGAGILSVTPGSTADKAMIKPNDIVYEFAGHTVTSAAELRLEVDSMSSGEEAVIKLRRNGAKDTTVTAHF